ncbi:MAG TPA: M20/M25/M40 family metallo-hydrolase [Bryobacteraceae bacterium]|nr:M20/M25/M40 family metallo-hydrolase [Bryobacteraceae bacterium]
MPADTLTGQWLNQWTEQRAVRDCLQWFTREKQWINEIHLQLCRIPAPTFQEAERAQWFAGQFAELGWETSIDRAGNVLATLGGPPYVGLTAHLDTVIAPRSKDDIAVDTDGRFRGPGVSDNGAGLTALLAMARVWKSFPGLPGGNEAESAGDAPEPGLLLAANVGEEGEGNLLGMRYLCKQSPLARRFQAFVVVDGANTDHITNRALGSRRFEASFTGPGGHSWSDFGVANPVHALCRAVALFAETRLDGSPKSAFNVGLIEGGSSVNAIAQSARAKVDIRSESNQKMDELVDLLDGAMERAREFENQRATGGRISSRLKEIGARPAAVLPEDAEILRYARAVDAHLGIRSHLDCSSTDANIPLSLGTSAIAIGAGGQGGGAHTTQEWFRPEGRDLGLKRIFLLLVMLLGRRAASPEPPARNGSRKA